jgi:transcriptional regulator of acetoin/glycerol metabolism
MKKDYLSVKIYRKLPEDLGQFTYIELTLGQARRKLLRLDWIGPKTVRQLENVFIKCCWECGEEEILTSELSIKLCQECAEKIVLRK